MKYTCDGEAVNPPINVGNIPHGTQSLALIVEDPDAPGGTYDHWIVWNITPASGISENSNPGISGNNSSDKTGYHPPCPPDGSHRYFFHVYALDSELQLAPGSKKSELKRAMKNHLLGKGSVMAMYERESSDYER
jgi:Raf kinase inhibitor-like YbhB/YbcL family protein